MKISKFSTWLVLGALLAGCATVRDQYDIRPDAADDGIPTAVAWQGANAAKLAAATSPEALAKLVASPAAADALLAQVKGAYATDPVVMTQIGCVTQLVLDPGNPNRAGQRLTWVSALERAKRAAKDAYVRTFCEQQLWQCRPVE